MTFRSSLWFGVKTEQILTPLLFSMPKLSIQRCSVQSLLHVDRKKTASFRLDLMNSNTSYKIGHFVCLWVSQPGKLQPGRSISRVLVRANLNRRLGVWLEIAFFSIAFKIELRREEFLIYWRFWPLCRQKSATVVQGELQWEVLPHAWVLALLIIIYNGICYYYYYYYYYLFWLCLGPRNPGSQHFVRLAWKISFSHL